LISYLNRVLGTCAYLLANHRYPVDKVHLNLEVRQANDTGTAPRTPGFSIQPINEHRFFSCACCLRRRLRPPFVAPLFCAFDLDGPTWHADNIGASLRGLLLPVPRDLKAQLIAQSSGDFLFPGPAFVSRINQLNQQHHKSNHHKHKGEHQCHKFDRNNQT